MFNEAQLAAWLKMRLGGRVFNFFDVAEAVNEFARQDIEDRRNQWQAAVNRIHGVVK